MIPHGLTRSTARACRPFRDRPFQPIYPQTGLPCSPTGVAPKGEDNAERAERALLAAQNRPAPPWATRIRVRARTDGNTREQGGPSMWYLANPPCQISLGGSRRPAGTARTRPDARPTTHERGDGHTRAVAILPRSIPAETSAPIPAAVRPRVFATPLDRVEVIILALGREYRRVSETVPDVVQSIAVASPEHPPRDTVPERVGRHVVGRSVKPIRSLMDSPPGSRSPFWRAQGAARDRRRPRPRRGPPAP